MSTGRDHPAPSSELVEDRRELVERHVANLQVAMAFGVRLRLAQGDDQVSTTWVDSSKRSEALWREPGRARLALDRDWLPAPPRLEHKVNLVMLLVAPVVEPAQIEARAQLAEDEVLEEEPPIGIAQAVPSLEVG